MDPYRRELQQTVARGRNALANSRRLITSATQLNRLAERANAQGDLRQLSANQLQRLEGLLGDRVRRMQGELATLQRVVQIKIRQARGKRADMLRQARRLDAVRRTIGGLRRSAELWERREQVARARGELRRTLAVNRGTNFRFERSQLPRPPPQQRR